MLRCLLLLLLLFPNSLFSQPCRLVEDIDDRTTGNEFRIFEELTIAGDYLFFVGAKCTQSPEVYAIQAGQDSVYLPKNVWAESSSYWCGTDPIYYFNRPHYLTQVGSRVFYVISHNDFGQELWVTDGTFEGTHLTKDIYLEGNAWPEQLTSFNDKLWFSAVHPSYGRELWSSDGTEAGTELLADLLPGEEGAAPDHLEVVEDYLYFTTSTIENSHLLWRTNGTAAGTELLIDLDTIGFSNVEPVSLEKVGNYLAITMRNDATDQAYLYFLSPGNLAVNYLGAFQSEHNLPRYLPSAFTEFAGMFYFVGITAQRGREPWRTDGTFAGTQIVTDLVEGAEGSHPYDLTVFQNQLYFTTWIDGQSVLNQSDGTGDGTFVLNFSEYPDFDGIKDLLVWDDLLWIVSRHGDHLWQFDGDTLSQVLTGFDCIQGIEQLMVFDDALYFVGCKNGESGIWKWKPQPDEALKRMKGFYAEAYSAGFNSTVQMGGQVFFWARDSTGWQIWRMEEGGQGAMPATSLTEPSYSSYRPLVNQGDSLLLFTSFQDGYGNEIWRSEGVPGTEEMVVDLAPGESSSISQFGWSDGHYTYFSSSDNSGQLPRGLFRTDGTPDGTILLKLGVSGVRSFLRYNNYSYTKVFFDGETWIMKTDGTPEGTELLVQVFSNQVSASSTNIVELNGFLYFLKENEDESHALWRTDGTVDGTEMVVQLNPEELGNPHTLKRAGNRLFFVANTLEYGKEIWISDGTPEGTTVVTDFNEPGTLGNSISGLSPIGDKAAFTFDNAHYGIELWGTDGTWEGTQLLKDLAPGSTSSYPHLSVGLAVDSLFYFSAFTSDKGRELWQTDGTAEGTNMVQDICPGPCSSSPTQFFPFAEGRFIFEAYHPGYGLEPWIYDPSSLTTAEEPLPRRSVDFQLYPNPTSRSPLYVKWNPQWSPHTIQLFDVNGRLLQQWQPATGSNNDQLTLPGLAPGLYLLRAFDDTTMVTKKLLITK